MKKIRSIYRKYMFRPTLYMTGRNLVIGIVLVLLWDRFLNPSNLSPLGHAGFCVGAVAGMLAWFEYLHLDGFAVHHLNENIRKKPKERHRSKDIVDFVDEKIISYDELEKDELILEVLGRDLAHKIIKTQKKEYKAYCMQVTDWEIENYLYKM